MNKKNKKLQLNKQIVSNLDDIKGGDGGEDLYKLSGFFVGCYFVGKLVDVIVDYVISDAFDDRGGCITVGCHETRYCSDWCNNYVSNHSGCM